mmetsp:Transcript_6488/g.12210  ORF Transcript_6488/g.12210 Transcript_6488/m.12210 type:complete len:215 (+) Transcript_6488:251-895(+)
MTTCHCRLMQLRRLRDFFLQLCELIEMTLESVDSNDDLNRLSKLPPSLHFLKPNELAPSELATRCRLSADPRMFQNLWNGDALCRIHSEHAADETLGFRGNLSPVLIREIIGARLDLLVEFCCLLMIEGGKSAQQYVENDTHTPNVHGLSVLLLFKHLGCNVARGTAGGRQHSIPTSILELCEPEVRNFDQLRVFVSVDKIFRLQIAMHNPDSM